MRNKLVGAFAGATLVAAFSSACSSEGRHFGTAGGTGGQGAAGKSGGGPDQNGGNSAQAGSQASGGTAGNDTVVGGSPGDGGAGGAEGGVCEDQDCTTCADATPAPGTSCGECGTNVCNPDEVTTSCSDPKYNACGGCAKLDAAPGAACGDCGKYECAADKESVTCKDPGKNACGGCGVLANAPASSCGSCGNWECTADKSDVKCSGVNANACGGCGTLANAPGVACGQCGKYACSADKASTTCSDPGKNACGGCAALTGTLNAACGNGNCGKLTCSTDKNSLTCTGAVPNACGGCATLTPAGATKDASCGTCGRKWACNADLNSLSCAGTAPNVCGGCSAISGTVGASCGPCSVTACAANKESLECKSQCTGSQVCAPGVLQCKTPDCSAPDSCGKSDGAGSTCTNSKGNCPAKPNTTPQCSGSSCAYTCNPSSKTLSCSTLADPQCGTWNFESGGTEEWVLDPDTGSGEPSPVVGGLFVTTAPGTGAGTRSLAMNVDDSADTKSGCVGIRTTFCPGGAPTSGIQGKFHASIWYKAGDNKGKLSGPAWISMVPSVGATDFDVPAGVWFDVTTFEGVAGKNVTSTGVYVCGIDGHKGTLYFDNIYFE